MARVYDDYLYEKDLEKLFDNNDITPEDSLKMRQNFINNWIKERLIFHKALEVLSEEKKDKQKELDDYYHSLIRYEYELELLENKLDLKVTEQKINSYYRKYKSNFLLKRPVVRMTYLKAPLTAPGLSKVKKWIQSDKIRDLDSLYSYGVRYATKFSLDNEKWYYLDELEDDLPVQLLTKSDSLSEKKLFELEEDSSVFFIQVFDYRVKNEISPLAMVKEDIKNMIINKRKVDLIRKQEEKIFQDALKHNEFEIYED